VVTLEELAVDTRAEWRSWLLDHHAGSPGVWLIRWKKGSGREHVSYDDVVEVALCFGWIDSQPRSMDDARSQLRVTPRKAGSRWSAVNRARIARLTEARLMHPAGLLAVEAARANGTWTALDAVETLTEPADLAAGLNSDPIAREQWNAFPRSTRRAILEWLSTSRTDATRQQRLDRIVTDAHHGIRANQWRQPKRHR
jgi:uncharacterized protein YdeI (YjbR/CyaY-like superfamily)